MAETQAGSHVPPGAETVKRLSPQRIPMASVRLLALTSHGESAPAVAISSAYAYRCIVTRHSVAVNVRRAPKTLDRSLTVSRSGVLAWVVAVRRSQHLPDSHVATSSRERTTIASFDQAWLRLRAWQDGLVGHRGSAPASDYFPRRRRTADRRISIALRLHRRLLVQTSGSHRLPLGNAWALAPPRPHRRGEEVCRIVLILNL